MCESRFRQVLEALTEARVRVVRSDGREEMASLLAFDGPPPRPGDWIVVHCGYALHAVDADGALDVANELRAAIVARHGQDPGGSGD